MNNLPNAMNDKYTVPSGRHGIIIIKTHRCHTRSSARTVMRKKAYVHVGICNGPYCTATVCKSGYQEFF